MLFSASHISDMEPVSWQEHALGAALMLFVVAAVSTGITFLVRRWAGRRHSVFWVAGGAITLGSFALARKVIRLTHFYEESELRPPAGQLASDLLSAIGDSLGVALFGTFSAFWVSLLFYQIFPSRSARLVAKQSE